MRTTDIESSPHGTPINPEATVEKLDHRRSNSKRKADDESGHATVLPKRRAIGESTEDQKSHAMVDHNPSPVVSDDPEGSLRKHLPKLYDDYLQDRTEEVYQLLRQRVKIWGPGGIAEQTGVDLAVVALRARLLEAMGELYTDEQLDAKIDEMLMQKVSITGPGSIVEKLKVGRYRVRLRKEALEKAGQLSTPVKRHAMIDSLLKEKIEVEGPGGIMEQLGVGRAQVKRREEKLRESGDIQ